MRKISRQSPIFLTAAADFAKKLFFARGRLVAFVVLFLLTAALVVSTGAWAKKRKPQKSKSEVTLTRDLRNESKAQRAATRNLVQRKSLGKLTSRANQANDDGDVVRTPLERRLIKAREFTGDLRNLPKRRPVEKEKPERDGPDTIRRLLDNPLAQKGPLQPSVALQAAAAPTPLLEFEGLDRATWGAGSPPDTTGDVGPNHYIQAVNTSVGIYDKTTGAQITAFTFDTLMSQGSFGNLCDTENFGDPIVLYDTFEDRWILTDFAFILDGGGNVNPQDAYQCFAASKTSDPVAGGWNFYSIETEGGLGDYPKLGIWPDGVYMSINLFGYAASAGFITTRFYAFNKAQMYAGAPTVQSVEFDVADDFTVLPSNARLQTGTPPLGSPNYFVSSWNFLNALTVYKFHVDWDSISLSTVTGPDTPLAATSWPNAAVANAPQPGTANLLDVLQIRAMMQNQYVNFGGVESLWNTHTVRRANTAGFAAPRWYELIVTGGTVSPTILQAATWDPDAANVMHRYMPSLALDRAGNMALGYSTSNATVEFPSIKYAGRLAADPINTFSQTETIMFTGTASQTTSTRWGDYTTMTLDPDGCTFWFTNEYANPVSQASNMRWRTRIGKFQFPGCNPVGAGGTLQGTVTLTPGGTPVDGATVELGARSTTTNASGFYSFSALPAGTYPEETASKPGLSEDTENTIVITDGGTTVKDFQLTAAPQAACLTDTTQADFQMGVGTNVDLITSPGDVTLLNAPTSDQSNTAGTTTGTGFGTPAWTGQTFIPAVTGLLVQADVQLFCNGCGATPPNLTLSVRNTAAGLPTGADLATATIPGSAFASGASVLFTATFGSPATLTSGTQYALVLRPVSVPSGTGYFWIRSSPSTYANGSRVLSADSGGTWTPDVTRDFNFRTYMQAGFSPSGDLVSSLKDGNPSPGNFVDFTTLSWNATVPANTTVRFQVAMSDSEFGPFDFVGPDGTATSFFTTSPSNIPNFGGNRYLKYKAYLNTTDTGVTPTLHDVSVCWNNTNIPTAANGIISGRIVGDDGNPVAGVAIQLSGTQNRRSITDANGSYAFDAVETTGFYTVAPAMSGYNFSPATRSFSALGNRTEAMFTASRDANINPNAIDSSDYFVRQQYLDFLGREPDESGFNFWNDQIATCGEDAVCRETKRINVSAAYFLSIEFQRTGGLVDGLYRAGFGRAPKYAEFVPDSSAVSRDVVVGRTNWEGQLAANKRAFIDAFVARAAFRDAYDGLSNAAYVDKLITNTGVAFSAGERDSLISSLGSGSSRADVLLRIAENDQFVSAKRNASFVMMEYFGYLRRDPDASGYQFWLNKLNQFDGNFVRAEMVKAFINSGEYRARFAR
ncbi:MAG TPA: carboxypeptidase regulatory-like domain-containing protein [Pyrinomonadaceae bacterium]|nr:carboxypeptidase regulatory-like domain-containing protein [Pyrinomonadaceae bacterium]